ncbi:holin family protein [Sulfitobacter geojensis]|uniref:Holin family protein n=1 Tax=Sulfitobacter geojensis TaxID=1342299 RepID=A0AAE3B4Q7_9RHOB|nr:holin family protein [Sulfitobacter geojensis]MBM1687992.1 holin family protein [Sulfitobacter geojensis]MBM1692059.1 holin family protein [Sulfitobacter geojensis]MBM1704225.1 holin family protein [Sulfitobacter geojensis]MBM1708283.1 holin family protein [Sulfitobacter geojensis]MBM1712348.1 holin family protein [Sulfitobacter geojensis]
MGLIERVLTVVFGGQNNVVRDTVEVFRENAEAGAQRSAGVQGQAMTQYGAEFLVPRRGGFDRFMDGLNRLPRPALALGTLGLFVSAMVEPLWFAERMQGIALVPEPLWWLLGVIVSFYFGARHQVKAQDFQREIVSSVSRVPEVLRNIGEIRALRSDSVAVADTAPDAALLAGTTEPTGNAALDAWQQSRR